MLTGGAKVALLGALPSWVPAGASAWIDFVNNRAWDRSGVCAAASKIAVSRASSAAVFNADGSIVTVANNTARIGCDEIFNEASGLLVEKGVTNGSGAIDFSTAVVGTLGSGGALPTGVIRDAGIDNSGLTYDVTAKDASSVTIRMHGTTISGTPVIQLLFGLGACSPGDVVTASFWAQLVGGSWANMGSVFLSLEEYNAGPSLVNRQLVGLANGSAVNLAYFSSDIAWPVEIRNRTVDASTTQAGPALLCLPVASSAVDITIKFSRPSLENSAFRTTWQPSASRAAEDIVVNRALGAPPWTIGIFARMPRVVGTGTLWQLDDGTQNNRVTLRVSDYGVFLTIVSASSTLVDQLVADVPKYSKLNVVVSLSAAAYAVSANGKPAKTGSVTPPSGLTIERVGGDRTNYWNGHIYSQAYYSSAKSSAQVQTLSLAGVTYFDDFDRADGAVGTAPTGQVYDWVADTGVGTVVAAIASKFLKATDAGLGGQTTAYTGVNVASAPKLMSAIGIYSSATTNNGGLLVSDPGGVLTITTQSLHIPFTDLLMNWEVYESSAHTTIDGATLSTAATRDGSTRSHCAWAVKGNAMMLLLASGEIVRAVDSRFATDGGKWAILEQIWNTGGTQYQFKSAAAEV